MMNRRRKATGDSGICAVSLCESLNDSLDKGISGNLFQNCSLVISRAVPWRDSIALGRHNKTMRRAFQITEVGVKPLPSGLGI